MKPHRIELGPGQESVWDYPRPPRVESTTKHLVVVFNGVVIANTCSAKRVLETSHPPVYYIPPGDLKMTCLVRTGKTSYCEWKGAAAYYSVIFGDRKALNAAWSYQDPTQRFLTIKDHVAFYPQLMDACFVDDERVQPQPGGFYGGWITKDVVGPFKGGEGTWGW